MILEYCLVKHVLQNFPYQIRKIDEQMLMLKGFRKLAFSSNSRKENYSTIKRITKKTFFFLENIWTEKIKLFDDKIMS